MKKTIILLQLFILISCSDEEFIYYKYDDVTITRIQNGVENNLYYGYFEEDDTLPKSFIKTYYRGWNSGMMGLLIFNKDKTVNVKRYYGFFDQIGFDSMFTLIQDKVHPLESSHLDSIDGNYNNVIEINSGPFESEIYMNKKINNSKVTAIYPE